MVGLNTPVTLVALTTSFAFPLIDTSNAMLAFGALSPATWKAVFTPIAISPLMENFSRGTR